MSQIQTTDLAVNDEVIVTHETETWTGRARVVDTREGWVTVEMLDGRSRGLKGAFTVDKVRLVADEVTDTDRLRFIALRFFGTTDEDVRRYKREGRI